MIKIFYSVMVLIIIIVSTSFAYSQDTLSTSNPIKKNALSFSYFGTSGIMGISYDRIISKRVSVEVGAGIVGIGAGFKYYLSQIRPEKILFITGFSLTISSLFNDTDVRIITGKGFIVYLPIGINYIGKRRLNLGIDIGPSSTFVKNNSGTYLSVYGNLKIGYRF